MSSPSISIDINIPYLREAVYNGRWEVVLAVDCGKEECGYPCECDKTFRGEATTYSDAIIEATLNWVKQTQPNLNQ